MSQDREPTGRANGFQFIHELISHPKDARRMLSERHGAAEIVPLGSRSLSEVLVDRIEAKRIFANQPTGFRPIAGFIIPEGQGDTASLTEVDTPITPTRYRWNRIATGRVNTSEKDIDSFYDHIGEMTFGDALTAIISSYPEEPDDVDSDQKITNSVTMFTSIFTLISLLDRRVAGYADAVREVFQMLPKDSLEAQFGYGGAIDLFKNRLAEDATPLDVRLAKNFEATYFGEGLEEEQVYFLNGTLYRTCKKLMDEPLEDTVAVLGETNALEQLDKRRRSIRRYNKRYFQTEDDPEIDEGLSFLESLKLRGNEYFTFEGLALTEREISEMFTDKSATFGSFIDTTIRNTNADLNLDASYDPRIAYIKMFGKFFDGLSLLRKDIPYDAAVAMILKTLEHYEFGAEDIALILTYVENARFPYNEFNPNSDTEGAIKFKESYLRIKERKSRAQFNQVAGNYNLVVNIENLRDTRIAMQEYVADKGIRLPGSAESSSDAAPTILYQGESLN